MLEELDLALKMPREEYQRRMPKLRQRLMELETACWKSGIASIFVFEGWDAAGKGSCISHLTRQLDPRGFRLHMIDPPSDEEEHLPWLWRFWIRIPAYGQIAIFDRSWYAHVLECRVEQSSPRKEWKRAYREILEFERSLADDGYLIRKFFLHISKKEQKRRFHALESDKLTRWKVQPEDWERHRKYGKYRRAIEDMLERTQSEWAPWVLVEATDRHWTRVKVLETIIDTLQTALRDRAALRPARAQAV